MENQQTNQDNKALWIFKNFKDTIDVLPKKYRGRAWELVINYAFDGEIDLSKENSLIQMAIKSLIPLIKLRGKGGSQNGISNNPSGKNKANVGANVGDNINLFLNNNNSNNNKKQETKTEKEKEPKEEKRKLGEFKNVLLTDEQYFKLTDVYGANLDRAIEMLSSYIASTNKKYTNHYAVLGKHNWVYKKLTEELQKEKKPKNQGYLGKYESFF